MIELMKNMEEPEQAERNRQLLWKKRKGSCQSMIRSRQRS